MLALYHADTAVCAAKVRLVMAEKDIAWESRMIDIGRGDQFEPDYLKLNPNAVVPTLIHDGVIVTESTVINEYLDEVYPAVPMRPAAPGARARMRYWTKREDGIHDAINTMTWAILFRPRELAKAPEQRMERIVNIPDPAKREKTLDILEHGMASHAVSAALIRFARQFREMEQELARTPWLAGDNFTLADAGLVSFFNRMELMRSAVWRGTFPRVTTWFEQAKARPSFAEGITRYISAEKAAGFDSHGALEEARVADAFGIALAAI